MPRTKILLYRASNGDVPVLLWLDEVAHRDKRIEAKCRVSLGLLEQEGRGLRRPTADYLDEGIYELRIQFGHTNYRMLYFFVNEPYPSAVVVSHGLVKESRVPQRDIDLAKSRRQEVLDNWEAHTYDEGCA